MRILIGSPVRQSEKIFKHYLKSLDSLERASHEIDYFFILHNSPELKQYLSVDQYTEFKNNTEYVRNDTHNWTRNNLSDVTNMKNYLLKKAIDKKYDYFFLVDSDLILHPKTLIHLIDQKKDIIGNVFWTKWESKEAELPNAWDYDFYSFNSQKNIDDMRKKQVIEVGYTGACILISSNVIRSGVDYTPINNISWSLWEDRAFCIRAKVHNYNIYLSTYYKATHLYRDEDVSKYESKSYS